MGRARQILLLLLLALSCALIALAITGAVEIVRWERQMSVSTLDTAKHLKNAAEVLEHTANASWVTLERTNRLLTTLDQTIKGVAADSDELSANALRAIEDFKQRMQHPLGKIKETEK